MALKSRGNPQMKSRGPILKATAGVALRGAALVRGKGSAELSYSLRRTDVNDALISFFAGFAF
jgi:hypothetical protein